MKKISIIFLCIGLFGTVQTHYSAAGVGTAADLTVASLDLSSSLGGNKSDIINLGDSVVVKANIENIGNANSSGYEVDVYKTNGLGDKKIYSQKYTDSLPAKSSVIFKYTVDSSKLVEGKNTITVKVIDDTVKKPDNDIYPDGNLDNNEKSATINVLKKNNIPDLSVTSIYAPYDTIVGRDVFIKAEIKDLNASNLSSYQITTTIQGFGGKKKVVDSRAYNSGIIGKDGIVYSFDIDASEFKPGKNTIFVSVKDNTNQEKNTGNNSFGKSILVKSQDQKNDEFINVRQIALKKLAAEKMHLKKTFNMKIESEKCVNFQEKVDGYISDFDSSKEKHMAVYVNLMSHIKSLAAAHESNGADDSVINGHISELQDKIDKFGDDFLAYRTKLSELKTLSCGNTVGEYKVILLESKALLGMVHSDASDIRQYAQSIIFADINSSSDAQSSNIINQK